ncbi:hypothetical protein IQ268_06495 [Oculatella sp. LEGE 06141]|uniref:hormogonium polysaccharide biosynthesis protein HpsL n=1 Tax=Oculatella sp. LEGE 06141 TaxID=1828648 RepID=UPI001880447C|nr:hormogonium polysaccharide biosynthesis protein HpsL [Oculatella sp. LEGE 06141]MBE9178234.1 hypothetical protein [Oculatella sp. LEGE 06141]
MLKTKQKQKQQGTVSDPQPLSLKERLAQRRKAERLRKELVTFTTFAVFFSAIIGFLLGLASGPKLGLGAAMGVLCTSLSFKYPRQALWAFLIYMPFSGTITYTLGNSPLLQLAKDGFYIPALIGVIQYCRREKLPIIVSKQLVAPLALLLALCMLTMLLVNMSQQFAADGDEQPLFMGILGLKVLIGYVPLIVCAYYLLRDRNDLLFLMRLTVILILVCCGLCFMQYLLLKTGRCEGTRFAEGAAQFKAALDARCFVGGSVLYSPQHGQIRLPGTFVAPWQWGWFLISAGFLAFATAFNDPKAHWRTLGLTSLAAVFIMAVLSGQRVALALVPFTFVLLLLLTGQVANLKRFIPTAFGLLLLLGVAALQNPDVLQQRLDSFESRWNASPPHQFIVDQFQWVTRSSELLGRGLGRATNSARTLGETALIETYYPKLIYEVGPFGALAFLLVVTVLVYVTFKAYRGLRDRGLRNLGASLWVFVLFISYNTYYYPLDVDPVAVYYWFFAGVILRLPDIERAERLEASRKDQPVSTKRRRLKRSGFA